MNETLTAIAGTVSGMLAKHCTEKVIAAAEAGGWNDALWSALDEAGTFLATVPESGGGLGLGLGEAAFIARTAAAHAAPAPIAEALLANWLWGRARAEPLAPVASLHVAEPGAREGMIASGSRSVSGTLADIPWARHSDAVLLVIADGDSTRLVRLDPTRARTAEQANLAGEPRDTLTFEDLEIPASDVAAIDLPASHITAQMGLMRAAQIVGAMETTLALTVRYANERVQFGRPIARFQVIQHQIAVMAEQVAMCAVALEQAAAHAADASRAPLLWTAKALASENAGQVAATAHQVFGAMGFTRENRLQHFTRRLWAWREECGNENVWYEKLGAETIAQGGDGLWPWLTGVSPSG